MEKSHKNTQDISKEQGKNHKNVETSQNKHTQQSHIANGFMFAFGIFIFIYFLFHVLSPKIIIGPVDSEGNIILPKTENEPSLQRLNEVPQPKNSEEKICIEFASEYYDCRLEANEETCLQKAQTSYENYQSKYQLSDAELIKSIDYCTDYFKNKTEELKKQNDELEDNKILEIRRMEETEIDDINYTLTSVYERKSVGEFIEHEAKGSYYIMTLIIKNNNKEPIDTPNLIIRAIDQENYTFIEDEDGKIYLENSYRSWFGKTINPKSSEEYQLLFDIPPSSRIVYLSVKSSSWKNVEELKIDMRPKKTRS